MIEIFSVLATVLIIFIVYLVFQSVGGKLFGAKIEEIGLSNGPRIFAFNVRDVTFSLNALPLGCFVKFRDEFKNLHPLRKILIVVAGLLAYFVIALVGLGLAETVQQIVSGFGQIFFSVWSPIAVGADYLEKLASILKEQSFARGLGIAASKFLAFNLIPLGMLGGGNIVLYLLELLGAKNENFSKKYHLAGLLFLLPVYAAFLIAFGVFIWRNLGTPA